MQEVGQVCVVDGGGRRRRVAPDASASSSDVGLARLGRRGRGHAGPMGATLPTLSPPLTTALPLAPPRLLQLLLLLL